MKQYEDPINFDIRQDCGGDSICYENLLEIGQGGPVIGDIRINEHSIKGYRFGGPILCDEGSIYVPVFSKRLFRLAVVNRSSFEVKLIGPSKGLIFLNRIEGRRIYFFEDISKKRESFYELPS